MKDSRFSLAIVNSLVDFEDYSSPVNQIIDDGNFWELTPGFRKKSDLFIRYNLGKFEDDYFQLGFEDTESFYQVVETAERFEAEPTDGDVLTLYFRLDKASNEYERKIFSLGELMGLAGGFYGALLTIGSIFISIFSERLFAGSILGRIYQIDKIAEREKVGADTKVIPSEVISPLNHI